MMRVPAISYLHVDYEENLAWVRGLSAQEYREDVLLVAGDVSHDIALVEEALACLKEAFSRLAGCARLDAQIRKPGAIIHVYGHQHRNRQRRIGGVEYVSCCLGYPRERMEGRIAGAEALPGIVRREKS